MNNTFRTLFLTILFLTQNNFESKGQSPEVYHSYAQFEKSILNATDTTYVVNFWATWCKPCIQELPFFNAYGEQHKNEKIKVILVSLDFKNQVESHLMPFLHKNKYSSKVILLADKDYNTWLSKADPEWSGSIPATLLVLGDKRQFIEHEFKDLKELTDYISTFISSFK